MQLRMGPALVVLAALATACAPAADAAIEVGTRPGFAAPDFTLKTLDGGEVSLSEFRGRPAFINFWASWCGPCRAEMPDIVAAYAEHKDGGLQVLAIDLTVEDTLADVQAFVDEFDMTFPVLLDEDGSVSQAYSVFGLPTSVFVDAAGVIRAVNAGPLTGDAIRQHLAKILPDAQGSAN